MKNKPIKRPQSKENSIVTLKQKNRNLQIQVDKLKTKILALENKTLKLENKMLEQKQKIIKLQVVNKKLEKEKPATLVIMSPHDRPPDDKISTQQVTPADAQKRG